MNLVERVAVKVGEHMILKHLLVAVQRELLAAHGADFPVALHMLLELALVIVGWEDDLTQRTSLHVHAAHTEHRRRGREGENVQVNMQSSDEVGKPGAPLIKSICLMPLFCSHVQPQLQILHLSLQLSENSWVSSRFVFF
ncbi:hypothetical protein EYF80_011406 [Liparis tanakae]|uniref:Uncharacterized protein n=1 Tax=Liparis tanakae TaxID=230148 RepID=A0A4Z2IMJ4_9TELE|nr:hypothetical protein EYF80_011406 [Liparis tanakae]